jgi:hypothetical protein
MNLRIPQPPFYHCDVYCGAILEDGRLIFTLLGMEHLQNFGDHKILEISH